MTARAKLYDLVGVDVTAAPGTGNCALGAALQQHRTFAAAGVPNAAKVYYTINDGPNSETGVGTFTSPSTLSRDTVLASTAAGAKITATAAAKVYLTAPTETLERMIGEVAIWAAAVLPAGWVFCAGQLLNRTVYAALFAVLSTQHGAGDGSTTFGVPDMRGRTVFGRDDMLGTAANRITAAGGIVGTTLGGTGGIQTLAIVEANLPAHAHWLDPPNTLNSVSDRDHTHSGNTGYISVDHAHAFSTGGQNANHQHHTDMANAGGGTGNPRKADGSGAGIWSGYFSADHVHSGTTGGVNANHYHAFSTGGYSTGHYHYTDIAAMWTANTGSGTALASLPPGIVMNMIMYTGVFP